MNLTTDAGEVVLPTDADEIAAAAAERPTAVVVRRTDAGAVNAHSHERTVIAGERPTSTPGLTADPAEPAPDDGDQAARSILMEEIIAGTNVIAAHQRCTVTRQLLRRGISMTHLQVLWILREHGNLSVSRLADFLDIAVPNVTGLVDRMEQRGLVERDRDRADRRLVIVRPTSSGLATADEIDGWRSDLIARVLARLDLDQLERVAHGIQEIRAAFVAETGRVEQSRNDSRFHHVPAEIGQIGLTSNHAPARPDGAPTATPEVPSA